MSTKTQRRDKHRVYRLERRRLLRKQRRVERRAGGGEQPAALVVPAATGPRRGQWLLAWLPRSWRALVERFLRERRRASAQADALEVKAGPRLW